MSVGWLVGWSVGWLVGWLVCWLVGNARIFFYYKNHERMNGS